MDREAIRECITSIREQLDSIAEQLNLEQDEEQPLPAKTTGRGRKKRPKLDEDEF